MTKKYRLYGACKCFFIYSTVKLPGALKQGVHAGNLIKAIAGLVGGGGGGRPNMAQAGGKNPEGVQAALEKAVETVESQIQ